jgi:hypothetical protein
VALHFAGYCCRSGNEVLVCLASGVAAGGWVSWLASRSRALNRQQLLAGGLVATLSGSLACAAIGTAAAFGMVAGVLGIAVPALAVIRRARAG